VYKVSVPPGGQREFIPAWTRAACAGGIDARFMEVHPRPEEALCDGPNCQPFDGLKPLLQQVMAIDALVKFR
jgi:2-dehydro-3-deoxyphosphooctonate aldolase (KDO 8-P synthase)